MQEIRSTPTAGTFLEIFDGDVEVLRRRLILSVPQVEDKEVLCCLGCVQVRVHVAQEVHVHRFLGAVFPGCQRQPLLSFLRQDQSQLVRTHNGSLCVAGSSASPSAVGVHSWRRMTNCFFFSITYLCVEESSFSATML